jgi:hypothetical protein
MSLKGGSPVVPPTPGDVKLRDFAQIIDSNLKALFQAGHVHKIVTALPTARDGDVGDIYLVDITGAKKICVKFSDGWYAVAVTAI